MANASLKRSKTIQRSLFWPVLGAFAAILLFHFYPSFQPGQTLFSNDAPLGALMSQAEFAWTNFLGAWQPLNWIGYPLISAPPNATNLFFLTLGPVGFSKFSVPLALLVLGVSGFLLFKQMGLKPFACTLGALALMLNTDPFSHACWGLPSVTLCMAFFTLALAAAARPATRFGWVRMIVAGTAVGISIMEGYDVGAILSLYVAAFVLFQFWNSAPAGEKALPKGAALVAVVALVAALTAAHALSALIGTQIKGVVGTQQDARTKEQRWDQATMWSLPKIETLRIVVPGLFGYRMDTPHGGSYWGSVGQTPGVPQSRHSGSGVYAGVLVVLVAFWGIAQAARRKDSPFSPQSRRLIAFWAGAALISLLLAFGRHAPFYQFFYQLPYFSTIRNPIKFIHPFAVSLVILFAYGLDDLWRRYAARQGAPGGRWQTRLRTWWKAAPAFERKWSTVVGVVLAGCVLSWLIYSSSRVELERHLQAIGFPAGSDPAPALIAAFSLKEAAWSVVFLALGTGVVVLILSGILSGPRAKWAGALLGLVLVADFARANAPWVIYYDYESKYSSNPILDLLRQQPEAHRVAARLAPLSPNYLVSGPARGLFGGVVEEWLQHHFQFYQVQSLDIVQMPRMPEMDASFIAGVLSPQFSVADFPQPGALASRLTNQADAVSQALWNRFPPDTRDALQQSGDPSSIAATLRDALNAVSRGPSLYDPARFAGIQLSDQARGFVNQVNEGRDLVRFNRLLLQDAYPGLIAGRSEFASFARLWQLTNTRRILGMAPFLHLMNQEMDPTNRSFRVQTAFDFAARGPAREEGGTLVENITTVIRPEGQFAMFDFGAALPRAKLFTQWQVLTNDDDGTLGHLADLAFDPQATVLVNSPVPASPSPAPPDPANAKVSITRYEPKRVVLNVESSVPGVLLLNDRFDPNWKVTVDGRPEEMLRCNYIMRGVHLQPGTHAVEFRFDPPHWMFYLSLGSILVGAALCGMLSLNRGEAPPNPEP
ncbi:MAG: hypothetical protein AB9869_33680 [Verrucomicrobiia bacterium]